MKKESEQKTVRRLAEQYAAEGYEVYLERDAQRVLPEGLRGFVPDMVVRRGDETIIIEIKQKGVPRDDVKLLAEQVRRQPGWRLDVHYVEPGLEPVVVSPADVKSSIANSKRLFSGGDKLAAFLLLWSTFEAAAMSTLSREKGVVFNTTLAPASLIKQLTFEGILEDTDHNQLLDMVQLRHMVVHGGVTTAVDDADFEFLASVTNRLTGPLKPGTQAA